MEFNLQGTSAPMHEMCRKETRQASDDKNHDENKDGLTTDEIEDPWNPPFLACPSCKDDTKSHWEQTDEWHHKTATFVANSRATNIIIPDRTPQWVSDALWHKTPALLSILEEDDVQRFLHFFENNKRCMAWGFIITPETFNYIISENALRCAKVVLEGKAPELSGHRANPNCMNPYGYFPLHEAAERFSADMVKLLIKYGASANTRTAGNKIIENLLPLHVAVENTCLHKYLEDNLSPNMDHRDYIYKLIQLLCLPEMKIFLDTTRLLAKRTNNLLDEVWNYVKDGKLVQTAVLLLAGQEQIRGVSFSKKRNGIRKQDGFDTIMTRMMKHSVALKWKLGEHRSPQNLPEACSTLDSIALLVDIISQAGEALHAYITTHSTVPHVEVFERVDSIIKDYGFFPNGEGIDVGKLCPYDCRMFTNAGEHGDLDATKVTAESAYAHGTTEKGLMRNKVARAFNLDLEYTRNSFFPYWRSVLLSHVDVTIYPAYAAADPKCSLNINKQHNLTDKGFSPTAPNHSLGLLGRTLQATRYHTCSRLQGTAVMGELQVTSTNMPRRLFGTAAHNLTDKGFSPTAPNHSLGLLGRTLQATRYHTCSRLQGTAVMGELQVTSTNMPRRLFGTAALTLMKMLKNA